jgi:N-acetylneuraminic acid mutarotase
MAKTLANVEERISNVEANVVTMATKMANMEGKLEVVNNDVRGLKTALIEGFDQMKDVLVKMEDRMKENTRKVRNTASGDKENIIVAGGLHIDSVEIFNWSQKSWAPLQSMPEKRWGATSFLYNNHIMIAGGSCTGSGLVDNMIRMNIDPNPDLSTHWSDCPVKLPAKLAYHSSVLYNNQLMVTVGGESLDQTSDCIHEVQLVPPYAVKTLSRMPEPRQGHSIEIFDENLLIFGGCTTEIFEDNLSSVILYDIKKNECKQLAPLPYEVSDMATVRWGDNIVVIGGMDKDGDELDAVIMYNVTTEQSYMLPPMRCKRRGCTAVVIQNNIVVLGGMNEQRDELKSVEAFNFESYHWEELPEMSEERLFHTAVAV